MLVIDSYRNSEKVIRAVFYDRYGYVKEDQYKLIINIESKHRDLLQRHSNWKAIFKYSDFGFSSTHTKNRPSFNQMIEEVKKGAFELLVVQNICRISRNSAVVLEIVNKLKQYGVEVYFVDEDIWTFANDAEVKVPFKDEWNEDKN